MFIKDLDPKSELGQRCLTYTQNKGQLHQDPSKVSKGLHFLVAFQCKRNPQHRFANTIVKQSNLDDPEECPRCNRASSLAEAVLGRERGASVSASGDASDSDLASTSESELAPSRIKRRKVGAQAASPAPSAAEESPASTSSDDVPAAKRNIAKKTARPMLDHPIVTKKLKRHRDQSPERTSTPVSQRMPTPLAVKNETKGTLAVLGPRLVPKDEVSLSDGPFAKAFWRSQLPEDLRQDDLEGMAKRLATTDEKAQATLTALIEEAAVSQDTYDDSRFRKDLTFLTKVFHKAGGELKHQVLSLAPVPSVNVPAAQADS
ncbi:hypothetical protein DFJ74DRAFT_706631 [Hyaloraphidium curvatum]|nr:hypothetical protein DFJ74DRAFT_706631 [Hyaloraphidium curvatum]